MVKRKASVSIDEWLGEGTPLPAANQSVVVAAEAKPVPPNDPTAEVVSHSLIAEVVIESAPAGLVVAPTLDVAASVEDEGHWFWALLAEVGYERW